jgi:hypothetical protein
MLVFSYAVEIDLLDGKDGYADAAAEAIKAYRARAACLRAKGDEEKAQRDEKRAEAIAEKAKKGDKSAAADPTAKSGEVQVRNDWKVPVTVVVGRESYTLQVGELKKITAPAASFSYELQVGTNRSAGTMEAGKTYRIGE